MILFKDFCSVNENARVRKIELAYCVFFCISGNHRWFCRIWANDWKTHYDITKNYGQAYGRNKFEAYRLAKRDLFT